MREDSFMYKLLIGTLDHISLGWCFLKIMAYCEEVFYFFVCFLFLLLVVDVLYVWLACTERSDAGDFREEMRRLRRGCFFFIQFVLCLVRFYFLLFFFFFLLFDYRFCSSLFFFNLKKILNIDFFWVDADLEF